MNIYVKKEIKDLPESIDGFIEAIEKAVAATGVARDQVLIGVEAYEDYGALTASLTLYYYREETAGEARQREDRAENARKWELKKLAELKAKYEEA